MAWVPRRTAVAGVLHRTAVADRQVAPEPRTLSAGRSRAAGGQQGALRSDGAAGTCRQEAAWRHKAGEALRHTRVAVARTQSEVVRRPEPGEGESPEAAGGARRLHIVGERTAAAGAAVAAAAVGRSAPSSWCPDDPQVGPLPGEEVRPWGSSRGGPCRLGRGQAALWDQTAAAAACCLPCCPPLHLCLLCLLLSHRWLRIPGRCHRYHSSPAWPTSGRPQRGPGIPLMGLHQTGPRPHPGPRDRGRPAAAAPLTPGEAGFRSPPRPCAWPSASTASANEVGLSVRGQMRPDTVDGRTVILSKWPA